MGHGHVTSNPDGSKARCGGPGLCPTCSQEAATAGFQGAAGKPETATCPACGHTFEPAESAVRMTEAFSEELHPRAETGSAAGGQFAAASSSSSTAAKRKPAGPGGGVLAFNGKTGPGYGKPGGDPRVTSLQEDLNRLGLTDAKGNKLKVDGKLGPRTTEAIKAAQRKLGVKADGKASAAFLSQLRKAKKLERPKAGTAKGRKPAAKATPPSRPVTRSTGKAPTKASPAPTRRTMNEAVEAMVNGAMSFEDIKEAVRSALQKRARAESGPEYCWVYVSDLTASDVVYASGGDDLWQCSYEITDTGEVTLGEPAEVVRTYAPAPAGMPEDELEGEGQAEPAVQAGGDGLTEASDRIHGRVIESLDDAADGGRVFRVRIIRYGDSKNGRRYTESVMSTAAPLYEGARAYDHHRSEEEMRSSTIAGLVGSYRNVEAEADGVYGDLHLLPSAMHAAEALDATLAAQDAGLPPLVGVSHDVMGRYRSINVGGRRMQEATAITRVHSADLVADPAAGGQATRMVAGGIDTGTVPAKEEEDDVPTKEEILAAFAEASDEDLAVAGLARATESGEQNVTEAAAPKAGWMAQAMIKQKVADAKLPEAVVESLTAELPERITEADVDGRIASLKSMAAIFERGTLTPTAGNVQITQESREKKVAALDAFFSGKFTEGYRSFRQAWEDWTGYRPRGWDDDVNKRMMRESVGFYDSGDRLRTQEGELRLRESMDSTSWNLVLGDSITRRMVAEYSRPSLAVWRQIVSSIIPVNDFRQQRIDRVGGYGTLPTVAQGAPYQPLTSPSNQEVTYSIDKKGGTEDITFEMIANDDIRAISNIPRKLGLAAAQTLYRFVFDFFVTNAATSYDGTALFHANHANTAASALSQSALSAVRAAMRQQSSYGDTKDILSIVPQTLIVPSALEELAWQLATSAVAIPGTPAGPSDTPNIHHRMKEPIVVDYYSDTNDWYTVADPSQVPTLEIGFYNGRQDPEMFTQSDPTVGSMFDSDKVTYKIRHIYSGAVLDHRGFYRNTL